MTEPMRETPQAAGAHVITVERWAMLKQQYSTRTRAARVKATLSSAKDRHAGDTAMSGR
jgi:hypothetical protein